MNIPGEPSEALELEALHDRSAVPQMIEFSTAPDSLQPQTDARK